jgi:hypothetical protein
MSLFRTVVIEARQFTETTALSLWSGRAARTTPQSYHRTASSASSSRRSKASTSPCLDDYIIKGVKGEFYPCKPDIFDATYEPATSLPGVGGALPMPGMLTIRLGNALVDACESVAVHGEQPPASWLAVVADYRRWLDDHPTSKQAVHSQGTDQ